MDDDLKGLVQSTLQKRGLLGKFKAQLKHAVISVIEEQDPSAVKCTQNPTATAGGEIVVELIREFNRYYGLNYTNSVLQSEASLADTTRSSSELRTKLNLPRSDLPLLLQLVNLQLDGKPPQQEEEFYATDEFEHESNVSEAKEVTTALRAQAQRTDDDFSDVAVSDVSATESEINGLARLDHVEAYGTDVDVVQKFADSDDED